MKKVRWFTLSFAMMSLIAASGMANAAPAEFTLRFAAALPPEQSDVKAMVLFKEAVEKRTNGRVRVDVFHSGQLGGTGQLLDQVKAGTLSMSIASTAFMTAYVPKLGVFSLPYIFGSREDALKVFDGPVGREMWARTEVAGFKNMGCDEIGWRITINNKRPIKEPDDFRGIKIRVQPGKAYLETFKLLGANPVAMDFSELYTALQQHVIDAMEANPATLYSGKFYEVTKYASTTNFNYEVLCRWMNKSAWDKLPSDLQKVVMQESLRSVDWQRAQSAKENADDLNLMTKAGMKRNDLTPQAVADFRHRLAPIYETFANDFGRDLINRIIKAGHE